MPLIGVAVVILGAFTGYQALKAHSSLETAASDFQQLKGQLTSGDVAAAHRTLASAQDAADEARDNTRGPVWWLMSKTPGMGDDVAAVRTVSDVVDVLAADVLPSVVDASGKLKPANLRPVNGRIDLRPLSRVAPAVVAADRKLQAQDARVQAIRPQHLMSQVAGPVTRVQGKLADAAALSDKASRAVRLLPSMLGAHGRRTYLVMFQNNAEVRATGGIPGAFAVITADHGRITMGRQADAQTFGSFSKPVLPLTRLERTLFQPKIGIFPQDVNFTPDFPRSAQLIRAMWAKRLGQRVDGVMSTDPVALSYMLGGTGPVSLSGGRQLTAGNAAQLLLNQVYFSIPDPQVQNRFFAAAARRVFTGVSAGQGDPRQVLTGLSKAAGEGRILVWSSRPAEERILAPTALGGVLPTGRTATPDLGVYLNDSGADKMDYYLDDEASVRSVGCQAGRQDLDVTLSLRSTAPRHGLPEYVRGAAGRGDISTTVYVYGPAGGYIDSSTLRGEPVPVSTYTHNGHKVAVFTATLAPGERQQYKFHIVSAPNQTGAPTLRVTPGVHGSGIGSVSGSSCS